jgi:hypothetical protein
MVSGIVPAPYPVRDRRVQDLRRFMQRSTKEDRERRLKKPGMTTRQSAEDKAQPNPGEHIDERA